MRTLLLLVSAAAMYGQIGAGGYYPPGGSGGGGGTITGITPTANQILCNGGTSACTSGSPTLALSIDSTNLQLIETPLSTPTAPSLTQSGTTGAITYGYMVQAVNAVDTSVPSTETQIATGVSTLTGTNKITVHTPVVVGSTYCSVYRTTANGSGNSGTIGLLTVPSVGIPCGNTVDDIGASLDGNSPFNAQSTAGGFYLGKHLNVASQGDNAWWAYFGTPPEQFQDQSFNATQFANIVMAYRGTTSNAGTLVEILQIATSPGGEALQVLNYQGSNDSSGTNLGAYVAVGPTNGAIVNGTAITAAYYGALDLSQNGANSLLNGYEFYGDHPFLGSAGSTLTNQFQYYSAAIGGNGATNAFPLWFDEPGVYVVHAMNAFDSVYQARPALYNPLFTKFVPGATNLERCIPGCQWSTNVAQIGTEQGGTGTLRQVQEIGKGFILVPITFSGLSSLTNGTQLSCSDCTVTSGSDDTCAGSGSGAIAERVNGVWRCKI